MKPFKNVRKGDKIRIVAAEHSQGKYSNGQILTVRTIFNATRRPFVKVEEHDRIIYFDEFEVIGGEEALHDRLDAIESTLTHHSSWINDIEQRQKIAEEAVGELAEPNVDDILDNVTNLLREKNPGARVKIDVSIEYERDTHF